MLTRKLINLAILTFIFGLMVWLPLTISADDPSVRESKSLDLTDSTDKSEDLDSIITTTFPLTQGGDEALFQWLKNSHVTPRQTITNGVDMRLVKIETVFHPVRPGGVISYFLAYFNDGNITASNVMITEELPLHTQFNPQISSPGWQPVSGTRLYTLAIGSVTAITEANGGFRYFVVTIDQPLPDNVTIITNTAMISAAENELNSNNNTAYEDIQVENVFDLRLTKTANRQITAPSDTILYTLSLTNTGNKTATNIILQEIVPSQTTFIARQSGTWAGCVDGATGGTICNLILPMLTPGQASTINMAVLVNDPFSDTVSTIINNATVQDDGTHGADALSADNVATLTLPVQTTLPNIDLGLLKSDGGQAVQAGDRLTYTLLYFNRGEAAVTNVIITETLPMNTQFIGPSGWQAVGNNLYRYHAGALATGPTAFGQIEFVIRVDNPLSNSVTVLTNTALVGMENQRGVDLNLLNNLATVTTPITFTPPLTGGPDLRLLKLADETVTQAGGRVTFGLIYANIGNRPAEGVVLTELLPPYTTFERGSTGWQQIGGSNQYVYPIGALPVGFIATNPITLTLHVADPLPITMTQLSNAALIADNGQNGTEQNPTDNLARLEVAIIDTALPDLTLNKVANVSQLQPGNLVTYRLDYANNGGAVAQGVRLTETVPAYTIFQTTSTRWSCANGAGAGTVCSYQLPTALAPSASDSVMFAVQVITSPPITANQIINHASIGALTGRDPTPQNNQATAVTPLYIPPTIQHNHLPLVLKNLLPDLTVQQVNISNLTPQTGEEIELKITLQNQGETGHALSLPPFWVDLYLAKQPITPNVNQGWDIAFDDALVPHGVAWRVYAIGAHGTLELTNLRPNDPLDDTKNYSNFIPTGLGRWPQHWKGQPLHNYFNQAGTYYLYVLVDSFTTSGAATGAILEGNESNNLYGPLKITVSGATLREATSLNRPHELLDETGRAAVAP